jgi:protein SCO1
MERLTRRSCITLGTVPVLAGLGAYAARERGLPPGADAPPRFDPVKPGSARAELQQRHLPNVPLVTHDGRRVRFYDDLVKGKKVVLTFVSSRAPRESDKVTQNLGAIQKLFGTRVGRDMFLYSIARSPERDTPQAMQRWAVWSGAGPGWKFLTGTRADIETLRRALGFASQDPAEDANPAYSVALVRYGVEREMRWGHCQSQGHARVLAHSLLLDFGTGPAGSDSVISRRLDRAGGTGQAPVWNCRLLLSGVD